MYRILFVCSGNTCRSPMAEALFKNESSKAGLSDIIDAQSAGLHAAVNQSASKPAFELLAKEGINIENHLSRQITSLMIAESNLILVMTASQLKELLNLYPEASGRAFLLNSYSNPSAKHEDIQDPFNAGEKIYQLVKEDIREGIKNLMHIVKKELINDDSFGK